MRGANRQERLRLIPAYGSAAEPREVTVEFRVARADGLNPDGSPRLAYAVYNAGLLVGSVWHVTESTDRKIPGTRLRRAGRGRKAWAWKRINDGEPPTYNYPGLYESTRGGAVARIFGYQGGGEGVVAGWLGGRLSLAAVGASARGRPPNHLRPAPGSCSLLCT